MLVPFEIGPHDSRVDSLLGEFPGELFSDQLFQAAELVDRYALDLAYDLARNLGLEAALGAESRDVGDLAARLSAVPGFLPALSWLLERLTEDGALGCDRGDPAAPRYHLERPLRAGEPAALRLAAAAIHPGLVRNLDLFDAAAAAWPAVAAGRASGEHELFSMGRIGLWISYFHNANPVYAVNNRLAAVAAANRLRSGADLRLLEVGAGAGSAAEALLDELDRRGRLGDLARYDVTEPSPFFRRRAERELRARFPRVPFAFAAADVDQPFAAQGLGGDYDLALGVNVLHVARQLPDALGRLRAALAPGGWLVAGECLRLFPGQPVPEDLVFQIFKSFVEVETVPGSRPTHGFLEPRHWRRLLADAGFEAAAVLPDLERIREFYPRFFSGAVVGRRPAGDVG